MIAASRNRGSQNCRGGDPFLRLYRGDSVFSNLALDEPRPGIGSLHDTPPSVNPLSSPTLAMPAGRPQSPGRPEEKKDPDLNSGSDLMVPPLFSREPSINQGFPFATGSSFVALSTAKEKKS